MSTPSKFKLGDLVRKTKGSQWSGVVVGTYSTELTPEGYAVESSSEKGSVQIYPAAALELVNQTPVESLQEEVERLRKASVPICIGQPLIQILAAEGQWISMDGQSLIAADCLFRKDPYIELEKSQAEVKRLKENRPAENQELLAQLEAKTRTVQGYRMACDEKVSELNSAQVEIERLKVENAGLEAVIGNQFDKLSALQRKLAAAEGMAKALVPFTCGAREVYPGEPCEDFGFQQKGTSAKVHAALSAYQEASK
jgi:DNA repair exonuclease SbcCD ATPase subunit